MSTQLTCSLPSTRRAAGRAAAPEDDRRSHRAIASAGPGQAAAPGVRIRQAAFDDPVGAAGRRQDHAGAADGVGFDAEFVPLSAVLSGVKDIREAIAQARTHAAAARPPHHTVRGRSASLQQVAAGCVPAVRRTGTGHLHRRDHRESVVRSERRAAVARAGVCAAAAVAKRTGAIVRARAQQVALPGIAFDDGAQERIVGYADGDARRLLNVLEQLQTAAQTAKVSRSTSHFSITRWRRTCAASTRAARRSTTRSPRCTNRCAAPIRMPRCTGSCACWTAAPTRATWRGASCAWHGKTSAWPIRARIQLTHGRRATYERLGSPEGELALAQAVLYLACRRQVECRVCRV